MRLHPRNRRRRGTIVPLLAVTVVAIFALVALAVDVGVIALARTHSQNAAARHRSLQLPRVWWTPQIERPTPGACRSRAREARPLLRAKRRRLRRLPCRFGLLP